MPRDSSRAYLGLCHRTCDNLELMKRNNTKKIMAFGALALSVFMASSCSIYDFITGSENQNSTNSSASGEKVAITYENIQKSSGIDAFPSKGNVNLLVIPVQLKNYPFASQTLTDLNVCFNGTSAETGYWESVSSFYSKSSYGSLNLTYTIADVFVSSYSPSSLFSYHSSKVKEEGSSSAPASDMILEAAVAKYKTDNGEAATKKFDSDGDGNIDGVVMVYSCPDVSNSAAISALDSEGDLFWAYSYWDYKYAYNHKSSASPVGNSYMWASYDFMYEAAASPKVDAHTFIHESGHMMGLDDLYGSGTYNPAGGWQMMDENILDHDAFTKFALGWATPKYEVSSTQTITISPSESSGDFVVISDSWNGRAFDEYMILELYTPTGLNALDSSTKYSNREQHYTTFGIKLYHVDARLVQTTDYDNYDEFTGDALDIDNYAYEVAATNCYKDNAQADSRFDLLRMISADNTNYFKNNSLANEDSLFETGDSFDMATYKGYFAKTSLGSAILNNGNKFPFSIAFDSVTAEAATLTITKN